MVIYYLFYTPCWIGYLDYLIPQPGLEFKSIDFRRNRENAYLICAILPNLSHTEQKWRIPFNFLLANFTCHLYGFMLSLNALIQSITVAEIER